MKSKFTEALIKAGWALAWLAAGALIMHEMRLEAVETNMYTKSEALTEARRTDERLAELHADVRVIRAILEGMQK